MIAYKSGIGFITLDSLEKLNLSLRLDCFRFAFKMALSSAVVAAVTKFLDKNLEMRYLREIMPDSSMYGTFTFLIGFVVVFHSSQAYQRYMSGMTLVSQMSGNFIDSMSLLTSFVQTSRAGQDEVNTFLSKCVGLLGLLYVACQAELEESEPLCNPKSTQDACVKRAYNHELIHVEDLDTDILEQIAASPCKVETACLLFQKLLAEHVSNGLISTPPPLVTRVYHELANGMTKFHEASKFNKAPYPYPYIAVADMLMLIHWLFTPFMVCIWTQGALSAFGFTLIQTFILWSLNGIAGQLDQYCCNHG